jgi:hypothetical protein
MVCSRAQRCLCWRYGVDHGEVARLQRGVTVREAEASAHGTAIHHARHPNYKHMAWHALRNTKQGCARASMRFVAKQA